MVFSLVEAGADAGANGRSVADFFDGVQRACAARSNVGAESAQRGAHPMVQGSSGGAGLSISFGSGGTAAQLVAAGGGGGTVWVVEVVEFTAAGGVCGFDGILRHCSELRDRDGAVHDDAGGNAGRDRGLWVRALVREVSAWALAAGVRAGDRVPGGESGDCVFSQRASEQVFVEDGVGFAASSVPFAYCGRVELPAGSHGGRGCGSDR